MMKAVTKILFALMISSTLAFNGISAPVVTSDGYLQEKKDKEKPKEKTEERPKRDRDEREKPKDDKKKEKKPDGDYF
jgi:hypothetical protein